MKLEVCLHHLKTSLLRQCEPASDTKDGPYTVQLCFLFPLANVKSNVIEVIRSTSTRLSGGHQVRIRPYRIAEGPFLFKNNDVHSKRKMFIR